MRFLIVSLTGVLALSPTMSHGHGSMSFPKSRVIRVYEALSQNPRPAWAAQAFLADGENPYYTWSQLSRNFPLAINGNSQSYYDNIPDGQLASAGSNPLTSNLPGYPGLSFSGLNAVSNLWEWPTTPVSAGPLEMVFHATARHDPSFFKVWITKEGYNHRTPLKWSDLEYLGSPSKTLVDPYYYFTVNLPERTGHHIIYCAYQRVDPVGEVFFSTSDVQFGGATGEPPTLSLATPISVSENAGNAVIAATLSAPAPAGGVTASYTTVSGNAGASDYTSTSGTLTFAAGQTQQNITVPVTNDSIAESDEIFTVVASDINGASAGQTTSTITIKDNDSPLNAASGYSFTLQSNWGSGWQGKLQLTNGGPTAWVNWTLEFDSPWTLSSISGGEVESRTGTRYVIKPASWNTTIAANGTLTLDLIANVSNATPPQNVTINGQAILAFAPGVKIEPVTRPEGDSSSTVDLTVSLEDTHDQPIHVFYATLDGTAKAGTDYTATTGTVIFAPGQLSKTITVPYQGNTISEGAKTFTVALASVDGETTPRFVTDKQTAVVTLTDDDAPAGLLVTGDSLLEGDSSTKSATFRMHLTRAPKPGETISVKYATAGGTATSGIDFTASTGTLVFTGSQMSVTVPIIGDTHDERMETFSLTLNTPVGCTMVNSAATGQIVDEDTPANAYGGRRIVAYADMTAGAVQLPSAGRVTHLMAAFASVNADGTLSAASVSSWNNLKSQNPSLKILLSVGGWTWSPPITAVANDPAKRAAFAQSCRQYVLDNQINGIDIDWEWPGGGNTTPLPYDRDNFTALVHAVRVALDDLSTTTGKTYELTCYAPATAQLLSFWDLPALKEDFDFFNVQCYDLRGTWENTTGHQSGLYRNPTGPDDKLNITEVLALYTAAGVPRSQILVGAPFYGQVWSNASPQDNGLFQSAVGSHAATYAELAAGPARNQLRVWDSYAKVPYLYDVHGTRQWTSYDDPQAIHAKAEYTIAEGYAGVYFWQLGGDTADRQLLVTLSDSLAGVPNPDSDSDNLTDAWEIQYYGSLTAANVNTDTDGDGMSAGFESLAKTDPTDPLSVLRVGLHDAGTADMHIGFDTKVGVTYRLERTTNLVDWVPIATIVGTGHHYHHDDTTRPAGAKTVFYRIALQP